jgi:NUMOD4 motif
MKIIWKDIEGYEGKYQVSNSGLVKSLNYRCRKNEGKERVLKQGINSKGYVQVALWKDGKVKFMLVHRLVALAFVPNPNNYPQVNHKHHGGKEALLNNHVDNLEWVTDKMNQIHARF